jgi:hypothetical protein
LQSARACFGGIFQKLTTLEAYTLAMAVQRLSHLLESSPKAPRTKPTAAWGFGPPLTPNSKSLALIGSASPCCEFWNFRSKSRAAARYSGPLNENIHGQKRIDDNSDLAPRVCVAWRGRLKVKLLNMALKI